MVSHCVFSVDKPTKSKTSFTIYWLYCVLIFCVTVFVVFQYSYTDSPNEVPLILQREVLLSFLGGRELLPRVVYILIYFPILNFPQFGLAVKYGEKNSLIFGIALTLSINLRIFLRSGWKRERYSIYSCMYTKRNERFFRA